jgi:hypothetical protein
MSISEKVPGEPMAIPNSRVVACGIALFLFSSVALGLSVLPGTQESLGLSAEPSLLDFGTSNEGIQEQKLLLKNSNPSKAIEVLGVITACSCEKIQVPRKISPGQSVVVPVNWNLAGRSGLTGAAIRMDWRFENELHAKNSLVVAMEAIVLEEFVLDPPSALSLHANSQRSGMSLKLIPKRDSDCRFVDVEVPPDSIEAFIESATSIRVQLSSGYEPNPYPEIVRMTVTTSNPIRSKVTVPVFVR